MKIKIKSMSMKVFTMQVIFVLEGRTVQKTAVINTCFEENSQRPVSGRSSRTTWENKGFDHGPDVATISAEIPGAMCFQLIAFFYSFNKIHFEIMMMK